MSEGEVSILLRQIEALSIKSDRQHEANQRSQVQDRETFRAAITSQQQTFAAAMDFQRTAFQDALNKQFLLHTELDKIVARHDNLLDNLVGDGRPEEGRIGMLEKGMETMKKFRWQALSVVSLVLWAAEVWLHGHGK